MAGAQKSPIFLEICCCAGASVSLMLRSGEKSVIFHSILLFNSSLSLSPFLRSLIALLLPESRSFVKGVFFFFLGGGVLEHVSSPFVGFRSLIRLSRRGERERKWADGWTDGRV